jgi:TolA-binding protein
MKKGMLMFGLILLAVACAKNNEKEVEALYTAGQLAMAAQQYDSALIVYDTILKKFPQHPKNDRALFLMGYIEQEFRGNEEKAKRYFSDLVAKYPKSDLVKDARFYLSGQMPKI